MNAKVLGIFLLLVGLCLFLSFYTPESFLKGNNVENLLRRTSMYGVLGIGVAFVIITGGIDLSIGSMVCLTGCLLALFLGVEYQPFTLNSVRDVSEAEKSIVLESSSERFSPGDKIRYFGGRRARSGVFTVAEVQEELGGIRLTLDEKPSRDDSTGNVAKLLPIQNIVAGQDAGDRQAKSTVEISAELPELAARDQVWFVADGLKQLKIESATAANGRTNIQLSDALNGVDESWMVVPLERRQRFSVPVALGLVILIALGFGALHGVLVTTLRLQPFVVTLCGLLFYRGMARWIVDDSTMGFGDEFEGSLSLLGTGKLPIWEAADGSDSFGIPYPLFVMVICAVAAAIFLNKTIWGRYMLALGRNEQAAMYSGINTNRMKMVAYVLCTLMAAIGGVLFALDSNSVAPSSFGNFFELYAIAAAVLGGCSLRGGEGGILGVVVGTALMQTLYNLIVLVKISDKLEFAIIGAVILLGVIADELVKRVAAKRRAAARLASS
ncbi:MAG: ABC transporter permease [Aureliella sp.]